MLWLLLILGLPVVGFWVLNYLADLAMIREIVHDEMSGHEPETQALAFINKRLKEKKADIRREAAWRRNGRQDPEYAGERIPKSRGKFFRLPVPKLPFRY